MGVGTCKWKNCNTPTFTPLGLCTKHKEKAEAEARRINGVIEVVEPLARKGEWSPQEIFDALVGAIAAQLANCSGDRDNLEINLDKMTLCLRQQAREYFANQDRLGGQVPS